MSKPPADASGPPPKSALLEKAPAKMTACDPSTATKAPVVEGKVLLHT